MSIYKRPFAGVREFRRAVVRFEITPAGRRALEADGAGVEFRPEFSASTRAQIAAAVEILSACLLGELEPSIAVHEAFAHLHAATLREIRPPMIAPRSLDQHPSSPVELDAGDGGSYRHDRGRGEE